MTDIASINVSHNIEVAHRLTLLPGKCQQIHGHSMMVSMYIDGPLKNGYMMNMDDILDFATVKSAFRGHLDTYYDHHLLLNEHDPFAGEVTTVVRDDEGKYDGMTEDHSGLPGLHKCPGDPTTENIAKWIKEAMDIRLMLKGLTHIGAVYVTETATNGASCVASI